MIMEKIIKLVLATLFFLCLLQMPYGYYQLVRVVSLIGFVLLANEARTNKRNREMIIYIGLAILFQPFFKIDLDRFIWNFVDVIVGLGLIISIFINKSKKIS